VQVTVEVFAAGAPASARERPRATTNELARCLIVFLLLCGEHVACRDAVRDYIPLGQRGDVC
jgi:hypothetical protein